MQGSSLAKPRSSVERLKVILHGQTSTPYCASRWRSAGAISAIAQDRPGDALRRSKHFRLGVLRLIFLRVWDIAVQARDL
jgi:hypothetical protein